MSILYHAEETSCHHRRAGALPFSGSLAARKLRSTASKPSLRRERSITSSTEIVVRPACLSYQISAFLIRMILKQIKIPRETLEILADALYKICLVFFSTRCFNGKVSFTNLCPNHFCQTADELGSCINAQFQCLLINDFSNGKPQGCLKTLSDVN